MHFKLHIKHDYSLKYTDCFIQKNIYIQIKQIKQCTNINIYDFFFAI